MKYLILSFSLLILLAQCKSDKKPLPSEAKLATNEAAEYLEKGKAIAAAAGAELSGRLSDAMKEKGVAGAVGVCKLVALPMVDSLSKVHQATIRRTSLRVRNPADEPDNWERGVLSGYELKALRNEALDPVVELVDPQTVGFAMPIKMQPLCLQCHGMPGRDIAPGALDSIHQLYPKDEAVGYQEGEFRGMWSIRFKK